jgi:multiple sugar transport system permease protein/sn-glycerol 3-phosphate transport system permease protein
MESSEAATVALPAPVPLRRRYPWLGELSRFGGAMVFLLPSMVLFGAFVFYPLIKSVYLGFFVSDPFGHGQEFVGFDQYRQVLTSADFRKSLGVTVLFALYTVPTGMILGLVFALLANQRLRGALFFRTVFSSTIAASVAVAAVMWLMLLNPSAGIVNWVLSRFDLPRVNWLTDPQWRTTWDSGPALMAVSLTTIWLNIGFTTLVLLAALQNIPQELYESARVDGASPWSLLRHITLPMLSPALLFVVIVATINAFQSFGQIHILTRGGPLDATNVIVYSIYTDAFINFEYGAAAVKAVALFVLVLAFTLVQFRFLAGKVFYR